VIFRISQLESGISAILLIRGRLASAVNGPRPRQKHSEALKFTRMWLSNFLKQQSYPLTFCLLISDLAFRISDLESCISEAFHANPHRKCQGAGSGQDVKWLPGNREVWAGPLLHTHGVSRSKCRPGPQVRASAGSAYSAGSAA